MLLTGLVSFSNTGIRSGAGYVRASSGPPKMGQDMTLHPQHVPPASVCLPPGSIRAGS